MELRGGLVARGSALPPSFGKCAAVARLTSSEYRNVPAPLHRKGEMEP